MSAHAAPITAAGRLGSASLRRRHRAAGVLRAAWSPQARARRPALTPTRSCRAAWRSHRTPRGSRCGLLTATGSQRGGEAAGTVSARGAHGGSGQAGGSGRQRLQAHRSRHHTATHPGCRSWWTRSAGSRAAMQRRGRGGGGGWVPGRSAGVQQEGPRCWPARLAPRRADPGQRGSCPPAPLPAGCSCWHRPGRGTSRRSCRPRR